MVRTDEGTKEGILSGIRIVDLTCGLPGAVATLLLAEVGADVIKVEAPGGDPTRELAAFATWNRSKRSVVLDLHVRQDRLRLDALLESADVLIHGLRPSKAAAVDLSDGQLGNRFPQLVVSSVLGYPAGHPDAELPGYDLLVQARTGLMDEQIGFRDGPIALRFPAPSWAAAYFAAAGIVTRLIVRAQGGEGGVAHTSLMQGALYSMSMLWNRAARPVEELIHSRYDLGPHTAMYRCADDTWLQLMNPGGRVALGRVPLLASTLERLGSTGKELDAAEVRLAFAQHPSAVWLKELRRADMAVELILSLGELWHRPDIVTDEDFVTVEDPQWGLCRQVATPLGTMPPPAVSRPAPRLNADADAVLAEVSLPTRSGNGSHATSPVSRPDNGAFPLAGLRVLDLGAYFAGPVVPMLLGDLGAEVIKVEPLDGDGMRTMPSFFEGCARGKRSLALDLTRPEAREVLHRLVTWADVVHHSLRPSAATRLGIDEPGLRAIKEDVVLGFLSGYGRRGPNAERPGFDSVFQALSGWEVENAGDGNPPLFSRLSTMDLLGGLNSLVATLLALYRHQVTGGGATAESSLLGAALLTQSETLQLDDGETLAPYPRLDGDQTGTSPGYRIYPTSDGWIAVVALAPGQRVALRQVLGATTDDELPDRFTASKTADIADALDRAGVPAEPVRSGQLYELFDDPANRSARLVVGYDHPLYGFYEQPGAYWNFGDLDLRIDRSAPAIGQHTVDILADLGYGSAAITGLLDAGIARQWTTAATEKE